MNRIILTGAGGFVGRELLKRFAVVEREVIALSSQWSVLQDEYRNAKNISFVPANTVETDSSFFSGSDTLLHCAFPCDSHGVQLAKGLFYCKKMFSRAAAAGIGSVINLSSQSVYNPSRIDAANEESEVDLTSTYAVGKYSVELLVEALYPQIPHTSLRLASLVGPGLAQSRVINRFVKQVIAGEPLTIMEGGQKFGYLDVRDAVFAILCFIEHNPKTWKPVYNVGTENIYTVTQIADTVMEVGTNLGYSIPQPKHMEKSGITLNSAVCAKRFMQDFDWQPVFSLEDTVREMFGALRG